MALLMAAVLFGHTLQGIPSNGLRLKQCSATNPMTFEKSRWKFHVLHTRYSKMSNPRLSGGAVSGPSEDDDELSDDDSDEDEDEDDQSNDDWLKYVPEKPEDDPEFMASFEQLKQAIIDAGKIFDSLRIDKIHNLPFE